MSAASFRAVPAEELSVAPLDDFTLIFHRASGLTPLVTAPAPQILELLAAAAMTREGLLAALVARFDLLDASIDALDARLDELISAGLVVAA